MSVLFLSMALSIVKIFVIGPILTQGNFMSHTEHPEKLNIRAGIFGDRIAGPFFFQGNLTKKMYLDLMQNNMDPALTNIIKYNKNYFEGHLIFQQDGALPHYALLVRQYLDRKFANPCIGRRGVIE